jgi:hypothetical protein
LCPGLSHLLLLGTPTETANDAVVTLLPSTLFRAMVANPLLLLSPRNNVAREIPLQRIIHVQPAPKEEGQEEEGGGREDEHSRAEPTEATPKEGQEKGLGG